MSLRGRSILVGSVVLMMSYLAFPSFFPEQQRLDSDLIRDEAVRLGLDLQGGIHWLLRIDTETAAAQETRAILDSLKQIAEDRSVQLAEGRIREGNVIEVGGDLPGLKKLLEDQFTDLDVNEVNGKLEISLTDSRIESVETTGVRQAIEVLTRRIDQNGITEPIIAAQGHGRILVQMPGEIDPVEARKIIDQTTFLEFKKVLDAAPNEELLRARHPEGLPEGTEIRVALNPDESISEAYLVPKEAILDGTMLEDSRIGFDRRNRPLITFQWNTEGTRIFREFTGANIGQRLAAIIDDVVVTAPEIQSRIGRNGQITGDFTREEAARVAVSLRSGALPIPLIIEEERSVGPMLGADSIRQGIQSIALGGLIVILFMLVYYNRSGFLATVALIVNLIIIIGLMSLAQATLTLPGLAGLVLTVGMAVDANVIIFERIREELRSQKNARNAIQIGFKRSALTIMDANVTTLIAAVVLLYFGRGPVQGFGVTLAIGIFSSVFCALVVTRLLFDLVYARNPQGLRI